MSQAVSNACASAAVKSAESSPLRCRPSPTTRSISRSTASGAGRAGEESASRLRVAIATAACAHFAALPCSPPARARPALISARNCCGVSTAAVAV